MQPPTRKIRTTSPDPRKLGCAHKGLGSRGLGWDGRGVRGWERWVVWENCGVRVVGGGTVVVALSTSHFTRLLQWQRKIDVVRNATRRGPVGGRARRDPGLPAADYARSAALIGSRHHTVDRPAGCIAHGCKALAARADRKPQPHQDRPLQHHRRPRLRHRHPRRHPGTADGGDRLNRREGSVRERGVEFGCTGTGKPHRAPVRADTAGWLRGGRAGLLHGSESHLRVWRPGHARQARRGDGPRDSSREPQGQGARPTATSVRCAATVLPPHTDSSPPPQLPLLPAHRTIVCGRTGKPRATTAAAGRLYGGRAGLLHGSESHLRVWRPGHARQARRGDGPRDYREPQGQLRDHALPRQRGHDHLLPQSGAPPPLPPPAQQPTIPSATLPVSQPTAHYAGACGRTDKPQATTAAAGWLRGG
eukprot:scaffold51525_cov63-Phaeocystis_antarctica.AAC.3